MLFFYVLVEGCTWSIASKLATNSYAHKSTIYRRYIKWLDSGIFKQTYDDDKQEAEDNSDNDSDEEDEPKVVKKTKKLKRNQNL